MNSNTKVLKPLYVLTILTIKAGSSAFMKNLWKVVLCRKASYISEILFIIVTHLSCVFFSIVIHFSIHKLLLGFINVSVSPIGFRCFTTLNVIYLRIPAYDLVALMRC